MSETKTEMNPSPDPGAGSLACQVTLKLVFSVSSGSGSTALVGMSASIVLKTVFVFSGVLPENRIVAALVICVPVETAFDLTK